MMKAYFEHFYHFTGPTTHPTENTYRNAISKNISACFAVAFQKKTTNKQKAFEVHQRVHS